MFVVEDGTGLPNSNSYVSVETANAYFASRNRFADWDGSNADKQGWLVTATDYIEARFGMLFFGSPLTTTQALSFPRIIRYPSVSTGVPTLLISACCEYAVRAKSAPLAGDTQNGLNIFKRMEKVGPIETQWDVPQYGSGANVATYASYPIPDTMIQGLLRASGMIAVR